ncbi:hypothetical protein CMQ_7381 [Grosmannia clavigera kw1407]|uniref:Uncharacterized protein n=1 Tax=Grosmannia clavigera (strain kw1407 / UAMH 11150) TaxID=655863 RepID=F0XPT0_GROCL|nr:uncharacterized protein CMQ_7381 [Grosmannia clavigera kw1407]EFX00379.1 hypothetical protein CMQ_7381 [Grosmannia clavigera kw1407]
MQDGGNVFPPPSLAQSPGSWSLRQQSELVTQLRYFQNVTEIPVCNSILSQAVIYINIGNTVEILSVKVAGCNQKAARFLKDPCHRFGVQCAVGLVLIYV